jgi:Flp pilus assembly protein TadB
VAVAWIALAVIFAAGAFLLWAMTKALKANSKIYRIRREEDAKARANGQPLPSRPFSSPSPMPSGRPELLSSPTAFDETPNDRQIRPSPRSPSAQRKLLHRIVTAYVAFLVAGFVIGYVLASGSQAKRLAVGLAAMFGAMLLVAIASTVLRVGIAVRTTVRGGPQ